MRVCIVYFFTVVVVEFCTGVMGIIPQVSVDFPQVWGMNSSHSTRGMQEWFTAHWKTTEMGKVLWVLPLMWYYICLSVQMITG